MSKATVTPIRPSADALAAALSNALEQVDAAMEVADAMQTQLHGLTKAAPAGEQP